MASLIWNLFEGYEIIASNQMMKTIKVLTAKISPLKKSKQKRRL